MSLRAYPATCSSPSHPSFPHARPFPLSMTTLLVGLYSRLCALWPAWAPGLRFLPPGAPSSPPASLSLSFFLASPSLFLSALFFAPGAEGPSW